MNQIYLCYIITQKTVKSVILAAILCICCCKMFT